MKEKYAVFCLFANSIFYKKPSKQEQICRRLRLPGGTKQRSSMQKVLYTTQNIVNDDDQLRNNINGYMVDRAKIISEALETDLILAYYHI